MKGKSFVALLLALALCMTGLVCAMAEEDTNYKLGDKIEDFSFTGYDGTEYTLYGLLEEKEMVLLNFWATWCGPCRMEFPMMNEVYEKMSDKVAVVALSVEEEDTNEIIADFAAQNGLSFIMGRDDAQVRNTKFYYGAIPTSAVVDRNGIVCLVEVGSVTSVEAFERLFDTFVGDDYAEPVLLVNGIPAKIPDVDPVDPADLAAAIGSEGLTFVNPEDEYNWPMVIVTEDDRDYVVSTNQEQGNAISSVDVKLTAAAGDVLALDYKLSTEASYDFLTICVNGEVVKQLSGERDWSVYAYEFAADGDYTVTLAYIKDEASDDGDDVVCFDNVRLLTGEEAAAVLASMPVYPFAEATTLTITNEDAKQIIIDDQSGNMARWFAPDALYYIVPGETAHFVATLAVGNDPDAATTYSYYDGGSCVLADIVEGDAYVFSSGIDSMETTGASYCYVSLSAGEDEVLIVFFNSEQNLNTFFSRNLMDEEGNFVATWEYADGSEHTTTPDDVAVAPAE